MLTIQQAEQLEHETTTLHFKILRRHGNVLSEAHQLCLTAIHNQLTQMCLGETSEAYGRWYLSAGVGFGKSTAVASFIVTAWRLGLLGNGVSITYTAQRVEQLYDLEDAIIHAAYVAGFTIPNIRHMVSVLHADRASTARRACDVDQHVPVLLISHEKIRRQYTRPEDRRYDKAPVYFLKYRQGPRSLVIWDERCLTTAPKAMSLRDLYYALGGIERLNNPKHTKLRTWIETALKSLSEQSQVILERHANGLPEGIGIEPTLPPMDLQELKLGLAGTSYGYKPLSEFLSMLRFRLRLIPLKGDESLVTYNVVVPDHMENVLVLDASASFSKLTQRDPTLKNLEDHHPYLQLLHESYGKTLSTLLDFSRLTFKRWNVAAGKDVVNSELQAYLAGETTRTNLISEVVSFVKERQKDGKNILIWTHSKASQTVDLPELLRTALSRGGVDLSVKVSNPHDEGKLVPQVVVSNYGLHDGTNQYSYCDVEVLLGVQRRKTGDIAASMLGADHKLPGGLDYKELYECRVNESAITVHQTIGRASSRITKDGIANPQETLLVYQDTYRDSWILTPLLKELYPGSVWSDFKTKYERPAKTPGLMETWAKTVHAYLDTLPETTEKVSSRGLKVAVGGESVAPRTWATVVKMVTGETCMGTIRSERSLYDPLHFSSQWSLEGSSLVRMSAEYFTVPEESMTAA